MEETWHGTLEAATAKLAPSQSPHFRKLLHRASTVLHRRDKSDYVITGIKFLSCPKEEEEEEGEVGKKGGGLLLLKSGFDFRHTYNKHLLSYGTVSYIYSYSYHALGEFQGVSAWMDGIFGFFFLP